MECETAEDINIDTAGAANHETETLKDQNNIETKLPEVNYEDDDGTTCPICLDSWTSTGAHRLCSLKCGHLFGHECLVRWLCTKSRKTCPTCKKRVRNSDVRFIYAKKVIVADTTELENLKEELEKVTEEKNKAFDDMFKYVAREQYLLQEIATLKNKLETQISAPVNWQPHPSQSLMPPDVKRLRLYMEKRLEVCNTTGCRDCRVFQVSALSDQLYVTGRPPAALYGGFGLRKVSLSTYKNIMFLILHKGPIRDMCFNPTNTQILTASTDKCFKITETTNDKIVLTSTVPSPPWSCCWSPKSMNDIFIGTQNGGSYLFDIRNIQTPKMHLEIPGDYSPVVSLVGIDRNILLVGKLNTLWACKIEAESYKKYLLPLEGPILSLNYDNNLNKILVSSRPSSRYNYVRHTLCYLEMLEDPESITSKTVHEFKCGNSAKYLANTSCFASNRVVAGFNETKKHIMFYCTDSGAEIGSSPTDVSNILDMKSFSTSTGNYLAYLNERQLDILKFNV